VLPAYQAITNKTFYYNKRRRRQDVSANVSKYDILIFPENMVELTSLMVDVSFLAAAAIFVFIS
jgi:hypothetical protein